jgi:hypothetical protein
MTRCVLIDLDGTLANSLEVMWQAYREFLAVFSKPATAADFAQFNGPPLKNIVQQLQTRYALAGDHRDLMQQYNDIIDRLYQQVLPNPGALALLQGIKQKNCQIGIITSNNQFRTNQWLANNGLQPFIDFVVSEEDVIRGKPDPEPYLLGLHLAECDEEETIAIEDSAQGVQAALAAGLRTFWLQHHPQQSAPDNQSQLIHTLIEVLDYW